jgi:two-component system chemotaxis sensor kinase CheA
MIREMHRNVHTLKGDSRMVQYQDIDLLCQKLEDLLSLAEGLQYQVSADVDLSVSMALDFMGLLLRRRGDQEVSGIDLPGFVAQVDQALTGAPGAGKGPERTDAAGAESADTGDHVTGQTRSRLATAATKVFLEYLSASGVARTRLRSAWRDLQKEIETFGSVPVAPVVERHALATHALALDLDCRVELELDLHPDLRVSGDAGQALDVALMHVVRNALSHGIAESDAPEGQLRISTSIDHDKALIVVRDNGKGIDIEHIRKRASERGAMHPDVARDATREELLELLFEARFSTRESSDEISGRGIGLDAVRNEICKVGGSVSIDGNPGKGAELTIRLPLVRRQLDIHVFDAYGGRLVLAVPAKWAAGIVEFGDSKDSIDPLARLQVRRPADDTGLTQAGPPKVLYLEHEGKIVELVVANTSREAIAVRICPTPESFPAEVVTVDGAEVLLLRPDKLPATVSESKES